MDTRKHCPKSTWSLGEAEADGDSCTLARDPLGKRTNTRQTSPLPSLYQPPFSHCAWADS